MSDDVQAAEDRLRALAEKATPGAWYAYHCDDDWAMNSYGVAIRPDIRSPEQEYGDIVAVTCYQAKRIATIADLKWADNAAYIAACDPQTVLAILDALAAEREARQAAAAEAAGLRAALERIRDSHDVYQTPSGMTKKCLRCGNVWFVGKPEQHLPECAYEVAVAALAAPPSPAVAEVQRLRAVEAAVKALFDGRNMAAFPNAPHCYVVDGEALDAVKAALGAGEVA